MSKRTPFTKEIIKSTIKKQIFKVNCKFDTASNKSIFRKHILLKFSLHRNFKKTREIITWFKKSVSSLNGVEYVNCALN